jgi:chloride channel 7
MLCLHPRMLLTTSLPPTQLLYDGRYLNTKSFTMFQMNVDCPGTYAAEDILLIILLGAVSGAFGSFFNALLTRCFRWRAKNVGRWGWRRIVDVHVIVLITSLLVVLVPLNWPCSPVSNLISHLPNQTQPSILLSEKSCVDDEVAKFFIEHNYTADHEIEGLDEYLESREIVRLTCGPNEYNEMASLLYNTGHAALTLVFSKGTYHMLSLPACLVYLLIYFFLAVITNALAVPAGMVVPSLTIGGVLGRFFGVLINVAFKAPLGLPLVDPSIFAVIGGASFWCGSGRVTVAIAVILLEITGQFHLLPAIGIAVLVARIVGDKINHGIYHDIIMLKGIPFLVSTPPQELKMLTTKEVMKSPVMTLRAIDSIDNILLCLGSTHNGFPVMANKDEHESKLVGLILRAQLLELLPANYANLGGKVKVDLTHDMNETPATVMQDSNLAETYKMFRALGLRHLVVINSDHQVIGMITRKDLMVDAHSKEIAKLLKNVQTEYKIMQTTSFNLEDVETDGEEDRGVREEFMSEDEAPLMMH